MTFTEARVLLGERLLVGSAEEHALREAEARIKPTMTPAKVHALLQIIVGVPESIAVEQAEEHVKARADARGFCAALVARGEHEKRMLRADARMKPKMKPTDVVPIVLEFLGLHLPEEP